MVTNPYTGNMNNWLTTLPRSGLDCRTMDLDGGSGSRRFMDSRNKNIFPDSKPPFDRHQKESQHELVDMAAEQIARLFWEQIKYNHRKRKENTGPSNPTLRDEL